MLEDLGETEKLKRYQPGYNRKRLVEHGQDFCRDIWFGEISEKEEWG